MMLLHNWNYRQQRKKNNQYENSCKGISTQFNCLIINLLESKKIYNVFFRYALSESEHLQEFCAISIRSFLTIFDTPASSV